jgi:predicted dehydrogenase/threonine dehydrogenase-like Zn-dependent dehydrogenase
MKQILQSLSTGESSVHEIPCPAPRAGHLLIRTTASLVSAGTERMLVEFGKASLLDKARQQPDKVRMALEKVATDGLLPTVEAIRDKLERPIPMGYCNVGVVVEVGAGVTGFAVGDRVASNGGHAEIVCVPKNLCARIPREVSDEAASFTVIGAIALQGIRLAGPTLGEKVAVMGLGLIGLVTVQLLRAQGCDVLGIDVDPERVDLARSCGAGSVVLADGEDPVAAARPFARDRGVDAVIITASTRSSEPVHQAAQMCRKRGRIVLVGVAGLELRRADFYEKELSFQVSCSYGPGRYDARYEEGGHDYPVGFVRWTEQRNFEAVLDMLAAGRIDTARLVSHRFPFESVSAAYELIQQGTRSLGIVLSYPDDRTRATSELRNPVVRLTPRKVDTPRTGAAVVGVLGAGNYATRTLIPALAKTGATLKTVASLAGVTAAYAGRKYGFEESSTDAAALLRDPDINIAVIATRHDSHADYVCSALRSGKHVFVEKPLCIAHEQLAQIEAVVAGMDHCPLLMVGFNRRFSPLIARIRQLLCAVTEPKSFVMTVNAGAVAPGHWTRNGAVGGGRIVGEACHFVDLLRFLAGAPISSVHATGLGSAIATPATPDVAAITLGFADGSFGVIHYLANGHGSFPKERLEVFCGGRILQVDNFRVLRGYGWTGFRKMALWRQDKGNDACAAAFVEAVIRGKASPIPIDEVIEVARVTLDIADRLG